MAETIHVRGEGGTVWEMDLPLRPDHAKRLAKGELVRVNADGSTWTEPEPVPADDPPPGPDTGDEKDDLDQDEDTEDTPPELQAFLNTPPEPPKKAPARKPAAK